MKFVLILLTALLPALIACRHSIEYDGRLVRADSLVRQDAHKGLALLTSIDSHDLSNDADRAYHALLLTQARYRCYEVATSDSTINFALDYYRHHPSETEKLTRCYIFKGAVMEELGCPEEAIINYKQALAVVLPDDHYNHGYALLRLGNIYRDNLIADNADVKMLQQALYHFEIVPDSFYILTCLSSIGGSLARFNNDSAMSYLHRADTLAKHLHQRSIEQKTLIYIADLKMYSLDSQENEEAKAIALSLLNSRDCPVERKDHLLMIAALTLAKENKTDSASFYLNQVNPGQLSDELRVFYHKCKAQMAKSKNDIEEFQSQYDRYNNLSDSLTNNSNQMRLREIETKYDNQKLKYENIRYQSILTTSILAGLLLASLLAIIMMAIWKKAARRKQNLQEAEDTIYRCRQDIIQLSEQLNSQQEMNVDLKETIQNQVETFSRLVEAHTSKRDSKDKDFDRIFQDTYKAGAPDMSFWTGIRSYADSRLNGIISYTHDNYPQMKDSDLNFLSLYSLGLSQTVIMACMGYRDSHSFYNKRRRITEKMKLEIPIEKYIEGFKNSHP